MNFEDILKVVGNFGPYQKLLSIFFLIPSFIAIPWFSMNIIFLADTPDHWCRVANVATSNLSLDAQKLLIRPPRDPSCSMYDVNYSQILLSGNLTVDPDWPIKKCDDGWQYDTKDYSATAVTKWNLVCEDSYYTSLTHSIPFVGVVIFSPLYGVMSDRLGRKPIFFFLAALTSVTEISSMLCPNFTLFLLLRTISGSHMNVIYVVGYVLVLELVSPEVRAKMNVIVSTSWSLGLCLLPLLAYLTANWIHLSILISSVAASLLLYSFFISESPRWLISQHRCKEAATILEKIAKRNGKKNYEKLLMHNIQELSEKIKAEDGEERISPINLLSNMTLRKLCFLYIICVLGTEIPYFGIQFNLMNLAGNRFLNFFLISVVEVPSHLTTWWLLDRIGRRWCFICGFIISATACTVAAAFSSENGMVAVIASLCAKVGASSNFMTFYQLGPEILPTPLRSVGMSLSSTVGIGSALVAPHIVYLAHFGNFIPYLCFGTLAFIAAICASFLPETMNQKLPQTIADTEKLVENSDSVLFRKPKVFSEKMPVISSIK